MRTPQEIKRLIAEFKPPISKAKSVLNQMKVKLQKYSGKGKDEATARIEVLDNLVMHCVAMQTEFNDMEEEYHKTLMSSLDLQARLDRANWHIKISKF